MVGVEPTSKTARGKSLRVYAFFIFRRGEENSITQNHAYRLYYRKFEESLDAFIPHYAHCTCIIVPAQRQVGHTERMTAITNLGWRR